MATLNYHIQRGNPVYFNSKQLTVAKLQVFVQIYSSFIVLFLEVVAG